LLHKSTQPIVLTQPVSSDISAVSAWCFSRGAFVDSAIQFQQTQYMCTTLFTNILIVNQKAIETKMIGTSPEN